MNHSEKLLHAGPYVSLTMISFHPQNKPRKKQNEINYPILL